MANVGAEAGAEVGGKGDSMERGSESAFDRSRTDPIGGEPSAKPSTKPSTGRQFPLIVPAATAFVVGSASASLFAGASRTAVFSTSVLVMVFALGALVAAARRRARASCAMLAIASACVGVAWVSSTAAPTKIAVDSPSPPIGMLSLPMRDGSRLVMRSEGALVELRGVIDEPPEPRPPPDEPVARHRLRESDHEFVLAAAELRGTTETDSAAAGTSRGAVQQIAGRVRVYVTGSAKGDSAKGVDGVDGVDHEVGHRVSVTGWLRPTRPSPNPRPQRVSVPNPLDAISPATVVASLSVPDWSLVQRDQSSPSTSVMFWSASWLGSWVPSCVGSWTAFRTSAQALSGSAVDSALPSWASPDARILVRMMLLGRDGRAGDALEVDFANAGLAHLVAISGFNLAVLAIATSTATSRVIGSHRARASVVIAVTVAYALIVEPQAPVARAAIVAILAGLADTTQRRWRADAVLALAAATIVVVQPSVASAPGFQLTFLSVIALRHLAPQLHARWYGSSAEVPATLPQAGAFMLRSLISSSISVWIATAPVGMWHFGRVALLGVPLSILAIPIGTVMLVSAFATAVFATLAALLPSELFRTLGAWIAVAPGAATALGADALILIARVAGQLSFASLVTPRPALGWCCLATLAAAVWCRGRTRRSSRYALAALALVWIPVVLTQLLALRLMPSTTAGDGGRRDRESLLDIRMLAVGDGSCYVVRSEHSAVLFDAGSSSSARVADGILGPALDEAAIRRLDAIVVTHPDLDHYSAIARLLTRYEANVLIVTDRFLEVAAIEQERILRHGDGATASTGTLSALLEAARSRGIPVEVAHRGDVRTFGRATWRWLHPLKGEHYRSDNDSSQVIRVECATAGGTRSVLFTGDLETEGMASLLAGGDAVIRSLDTDLLELPHHGSWRPAAGSLLQRVTPLLALQSTGPERLSNDRFGPYLRGVARCVTCRDGATRAELQPDGAWYISTWTNDAWRPHGSVQPDHQAISDSTTPPSALPAKPRARGSDARRRARGRDPPRSLRFRAIASTAGCATTRSVFALRRCVGILHGLRHEGRLRTRSIVGRRPQAQSQQQACNPRWATRSAQRSVHGALEVLRQEATCQRLALVVATHNAASRPIRGPSSAFVTRVESTGSASGRIRGFLQCQRLEPQSKTWERAE